MCMLCFSFYVSNAAITDSFTANSQYQLRVCRSCLLRFTQYIYSGFVCIELVLNLVICLFVACMNRCCKFALHVLYSGIRVAWFNIFERNLRLFCVGSTCCFFFVCISVLVFLFLTSHITHTHEILSHSIFRLSWHRFAHLHPHYSRVSLNTTYSTKTCTHGPLFFYMFILLLFLVLVSLIPVAQFYTVYVFKATRKIKLGFVCM